MCRTYSPSPPHSPTLLGPDGRSWFGWQFGFSIKLYSALCLSGRGPRAFGSLDLVFTYVTINSQLIAHNTYNMEWQDKIDSFIHTFIDRPNHTTLQHFIVYDIPSYNNSKHILVHIKQIHFSSRQSWDLNLRKVKRLAKRRTALGRMARGDK
jgi:hypothetical protein